MLNTLFASVITTTVNWQAILLCTLSSLILGIAATGIYCYKNMYTKSFVVTLALLPAMVQIVIMLVNGNLGAGVAVMGAFMLGSFPFGSRQCTGNRQPVFCHGPWTCNRHGIYRLCCFVPDYRRNC